MPGNSRVTLWKVISLVLFIVLVVVLFMVYRQAASGKSAAVVNGVEISQAAFEQALMDYGGNAVLDKLILEQLIAQAAEKAEVIVTEQEFMDKWNQMKGEFASGEEFQESLARDGYTEQSLRSEVRNQLLIRKLLEPRVKVSEQEIQAEYEHHVHPVDESGELTKEEHLAEIREMLLTEQIVNLTGPWFEELRSRAQIVILGKK
ncbi:SurA N-terminal domain-containing protein [Paenibacillus albidus]|uniref:SurA N-terminal domain-containing protein n=1 Tax=Paenibacillus albidus TaxID=2041023 RepID=UPI001BE766AF|nr:SurA N-terminal domain-containing protein [Paenibacillus albidus]MBT2291877.1 SurA N-terminal domain-containing protein [Paenibacillus albidus]